MSAATEPQISQRFQRFSGSALSAVRHEVLNSDIIYRLTWDGIARYALSFFIEGDVQTMSTADLRAAYMVVPGAYTKPLARLVGSSEALSLPSTVSADFVPQEAHEFTQFIARHLLLLRELPCNVLARLYSEASDDLRTIHHNIEACKKCMRANGVAHRAAHSQSRVPGAGSCRDTPHNEFLSDTQSWSKVYDYYLKRNEAARNEIVNFLTHDINQAAIRIAATSFDFDYRYPFRLSPLSFDPAGYSDVANKFADEDPDNDQEWKRLYREDPEEFFVRLDTFLQEQDPIRELRQATMTHHRLHARRQLLGAAASAFESGEWDVFATLAVIQLEGLFLDYCEDLGVGPDELAQATLPSKVQAVQQRQGSFSHFPYYAYRLPVVRNGLAHGRMIGSNPERQAKLLLLDLRMMVPLMQSPELLVNQAVGIAKAASLDSSPFELGRSILLVQALRQLGLVTVPSFYLVDQTWSALSERLDDPNTIAFVEDITSSTDRSHQARAALPLMRNLIERLLERPRAADDWQRLLRTPTLAEVATSRDKLDRVTWSRLRDWIQSHSPPEHASRKST